MSVDSGSTTDSLPLEQASGSDAGAVVVRIFGWAILSILAVFLFNDFLTYWLGWPGAFGGSTSTRSWVQAGLYGAAMLFAVLYVLGTRGRSLRADRNQIFRINSFLIRTAFWAVLLIGLVDVALAFLRGEDLLENLVGKQLAFSLARAEIRGAYVHMPLIAVSILIAAFTRTIGVVWLALLIVVAELLIVMSRFVFSYEQLYMTDLVRFWYAALFLFGCAYTLREEGHVRVDVLYTHFAPRTKGLINALGTVLLGMPFCWLILIVGMSGRTGIINSSLLTYEIEGLGDGMYILYLMTVFMAMFAISMLIEFVGFLFDAAADYRREPGGRGHDAHFLQ